MFSNHPIDTEYPIVQQFGDSPRSFGRIRCEDEALRGHHGVDFGTPIGVSVLAVADGTVVVAANDARGFGLHLLLEHHWGQTFCAHMSELDVSAGDSVAAGQRIGRTGESGLCLQPHLHFGLRINPYNLEDRWCGYTDPMPYLRRISFARGCLVGPHIIGNLPQHLALLQRWQPRLITVLEPNPDEIAALRKVCPDAVIVGRIFTHHSELHDRIVRGPKAAARWGHEQSLPRISADLDFVQVANEDLQAELGLALLNEFELERMRLAEEEGYACALFGFGVGHPDLPSEDRMARWKQLYSSMAWAETHGHIIALHQYGMPELWGPQGRYDWYLYRLEHQVLRRLPFKGLRFAVTETGIDGLILGGEPSGWRDFVSEESYTRQLIKHGRYGERFSSRVLGSNIFTLGHFPPWQSYDITGTVAQTLAASADRGTWSDVYTDIRDIRPSGFAPSLTVGPEALPDISRNNVELAPWPDNGAQLLFSRRLDARFYDYNMEIRSICERGDIACHMMDDPALMPVRDTAGIRQTADVVYLVKDVFMTVEGSWEIDGRPGNVPLWARNDYLKPEFTEAGAARHLFGAVIGLDGKLQRNLRFTFWSDGFHRLGDPDYWNYVRIKVKPESGWANLILSGGSSFDPDRGESGPWCWMPEGMAQVITGGGLPLNHHVTTFVVWQAVPRADWEKQRMGGVNQLPFPGLAHPLTRRIGLLAQQLGLSIQPLTRFAQDTHEDKTYLVRDLFVVVCDDESGEPGIGVCPDWASDEYLIPLPDADREGGEAFHPRVYGAIRSEDGRLMPGQEIAFARGDFDPLRNGQPGARTVRNTSIGTGWAQIDMDEDDAYRPLRGKCGPWNWAPMGAAEAVCGAGLPNGWRISVFAVWQALPAQ